MNYMLFAEIFHSLGNLHYEIEGIPNCGFLEFTNIHSIMKECRGLLFR
jgi:hypothetical protein